MLKMPRPVFISNANTKIEEVLRIDYAGEYGAWQIYKGQLAFMCGNTTSKEQIHAMMLQEQQHLNFFLQKMQEYNVRPTILMPVWHMLGYALGAVTAIAGVRMSMLCTEAIEEVIDLHYQEQIEVLRLLSFTNTPSMDILIDNIIKFRAEEIEHKNTAATYCDNLNNIEIVSKNIIILICRIAIYLSKK